MNTGFPEYSVMNDLIVLMPQVKSSSLKNFNGCWDYSSSQKIRGNTLFNTNQGMQAKALKGMIDRILSPTDIPELSPTIVDKPFLLSLYRFFTPMHTITYWGRKLPWMVAGNVWRNWFVYPKDGEEEEETEEAEE